MIAKAPGRIAPQILRDHGKGLGVVPGLAGPCGGGPAPAARLGAQLRRELPAAMVPAPAVLWPSLLPATQPRLPLPQPPLRAEWVHEPCSREDRGHQRSRRCPRRSSRPGSDMPSRLILQLQIVPAHNRSDLALPPPILLSTLADSPGWEAIDRAEAVHVPRSRTPSSSARASMSAGSA
jgi:hypothetical protein